MVADVQRVTFLEGWPGVIAIQAACLSSMGQQANAQQLCQVRYQCLQHDADSRPSHAVCCSDMLSRCVILTRSAC